MLFNDYVSVQYTRMKKLSSLIAQRDYIDKRFIIKDGNDIYVYVSSLPDHFEEKSNHYIRAHALVCITRVRKNDDGTFLMDTFNQVDNNFSSLMKGVADSATVMMLPSSSKTIVEGMFSHLKEIP